MQLVAASTRTAVCWQKYLPPFIANTLEFGLKCSVAIRTTFRNASSEERWTSVFCWSNRAQWEIREMAYKMLAEVKKVAPTLFFNAGASCVNTGHCPEGEMTCGKFAEMIKLREKD